MKPGRRYFLCGVGGSGMSALAQVLLARGHRVAGSDRSHDRGRNTATFRALEVMGVTLYPQDGTGIRAGADTLVASSAVENTIPDVRAARELGLPIQRRAELLAELFATFARRIAVGGTSGKSTVTAMISHILSSLGADPTMVNGAVALTGRGTGLGNVRAGRSDVCVIEADESDRTIELYQPSVSVLTNVGLDHHPMDETLPLFRQFVSRADTGSVINADCPESRRLLPDAGNPVTFGVVSDADLCATDIVATSGGMQFSVAGRTVRLRIPGRHNVANALAAVAAAMHLGHDPHNALQTLHTFTGIRRRLEHVGVARGITVVDDFAHNPDKIAASLEAMREHAKRIICIFQPHGYSPLRLFGDELCETFTNRLGHSDLLILSDVYYAGGTVTRDVTPANIVETVAAGGVDARCIPDRTGILECVTAQAAPGDCVIVMGARDPSLSAFARDILASLSDAKEGNVQ